MLELTEATFQQALKDAFEAGLDTKGQMIIQALNNDAVIQTNLPVSWLEYIIKLIEDEK